MPACGSTERTLPISPVAFLRTCPGGSGVAVVFDRSPWRPRSRSLGCGLGLGGVRRRDPAHRTRGRPLSLCVLLQLLERHHVGAGSLRVRVKYPSLPHVSPSLEGVLTDPRSPARTEPDTLRPWSGAMAGPVPIATSSSSATTISAMRPGARSKPRERRSPTSASRTRMPSGDVLGDDVDAVAVVGRTDAVVLRRALIVRRLNEDTPLLLTIFDPTMAETMERELPNTQVTSLADIVAPSLAGPCIDERFTAVGVEGEEPVGLVEDGDEVREEPIARPSATARRRWHERSSPHTTRRPGCCCSARSAWSRCSWSRRSPRCSCSTTRSSTRSTAPPRRSSRSTPTSRSRTDPAGTSSSPRRRC